MTKEEAKTKWCPMARFYNGGLSTPAYNRGSGFKSKCIASDCMMWVSTHRDEVGRHGRCGLTN